jgi:hypothetical protein
MNEGLIFREKSRSAEMCREKNEFVDDSKCQIQFETKDPKITFLNCQLKLERGKKVLKKLLVLTFFATIWKLKSNSSLPLLCWIE